MPLHWLLRQATHFLCRQKWLNWKQSTLSHTDTIIMFPFSFHPENLIRPLCFAVHSLCHNDDGKTEESLLNKIPSFVVSIALVLITFAQLRWIVIYAAQQNGIVFVWKLRTNMMVTACGSIRKKSTKNIQFAAIVAQSKCWEWMRQHRKAYYASVQWLW